MKSLPLKVFQNIYPLLDSNRTHQQRSIEIVIDSVVLTYVWFLADMLTKMNRMMHHWCQYMFDFLMMNLIIIHIV